MTWQVKFKSKKDKGKPGLKENPLPATLAKDKFFKPKKKEEK